VGADQGYLSDAIAEGLITELARSRSYAVVARNSSFKYRGQATDVREIGRDRGGPGFSTSSVPRSALA
jgi:TolB-like protein